MTILKPSGKKALLIDGKAASADLLERVAAGGRRCPASSRVWPWCWSAPTRRARSMSSPRARRRIPAASIPSSTICPPRRARPNWSVWCAASTPIPPSTAYWCSCRCRRASIPAKVLQTVAPEKDVDGFHPVNVGLLATGAIERALVPCTPAGAMLLIEAAAKFLQRDIAGAEAVIVGRSNIVGKPMAQLLLAKNATVTIAHSRTRDLPAVARRADILVAAVGRPEMIQGDWIKPGALVIDVGINRVPGEGLTTSGQPKTRLVGDVALQRGSRRRRRDHAGSGRCRSDDHRHADGQYFARGQAEPRLSSSSLLDDDFPHKRSGKNRGSLPSV